MLFLRSKTILITEILHNVVVYLSCIQGGEPRAAPSAGGGRAGEGGAELHHAGVQRQLRHHAQVRGTVGSRSLADTH